MLKEEMEFLGKDENGYEYVLASDYFVYQFQSEKNLGLFCSWPAWNRTLKNILIK